MHVRELKPEVDLAEQFARDHMPDRTASGVHVSSVIRWIEVKTGKREVRGDTPEEREALALYTSMGWAWESLIRDALMRVWTNGYRRDARWIAPGELEQDGIIGSPDWFDSEDCVLEEFKCTYRSSNRPIETDWWHWMVQMKAYCYLLGVYKIRLRVFFVCGNYKPIKPEIRMWELTFSDREVQDNWLMIRNNALAMEKEKRSGKG
jgi:hypothetical protein